MKWWGHGEVLGQKSAAFVGESRGAGPIQRAGYSGIALRSACHRVRERLATPVLRACLGMGVAPFSNRWFARGAAIHRYYVERYLSQQAADIRGQCLEFQEDSYTSRFGGSRVTRLEILHKERDPHAPQATLFADLTRGNAVPSGSFDCIICTYVLHIIDDVPVFVNELHRLLRRDGVLLVVVPNITVAYPEFPELWRFTPLGLTRLLERAFGAGNIQARSYGNSLTCAGEIRGLGACDFTIDELDHNDPRFGLVTCARAHKAGTA